ncbi:condensation protein [Streptomyces sp. NPDC091266]|uniref:condensation protein n=1 Tax=Streptomyces sp. NPDC091266 TaxID=3365978 RepID=UPI0038169866
MTALQPARHDPPGDGPERRPLGGGRAEHAARVPFPVVDEISRHCLRADEPETVHIEVHLPGRVDHARLRDAFHQALAGHPRILMRQEPARWWHRRYTWQLTTTPDVDPVAFPPPGPDALARARERALADCPPLDASPPVRLEVIERVEHDGPSDAGDGYGEGPGNGASSGGGGGTVLLITLHHTALDGPACLRVLATAAELYGGADNSPAPPPVRSPGRLTHEPPPPGATPGPLRRLTRPARIAAHHTAAGGGTGTGRAGSDTAGPAGSAGNGMLIVELPVPDRPPRAGGRAPYTVNDQLLVATFLMVARWNREHGHAPGPERATDAPVLVTMPVDDRPRGAAMPIGNGTRLVSVGFGPEEHREAGLLTSDPPDPGAMDRLLRRTAARTRALKSASGAQLGLSGTVLTTPVLPVGIRGAVTRALRSAAAPWTSTTLLSNIGRIPYPLDFGDAGRPTAVWFSAPARMPRGLTVTTASAGGRIQLALRWSHALLDDAAGARLGDLFASSLAATAWTPPSTRPAPPPRSAPPEAPRDEGKAR